MSNLVTLNSTPSFQYDWHSIEDSQSAAAAKSAVDSYSVQFHALKDQASKLLETNTLALSKCVLVLKESLQHGEFQSVCQQALKLDTVKAGALVTVGRALMQGTVPSEALQLLNQMEPRAARQFLKADEEVKSSHVAAFEQTGKVPSRRDFTTPKPPTSPTTQPKVEQYTSEAPEQILELTQNKWEAKDRFSAYKIRPVHALEAMAEMLSSQKELRPDVESALVSLAKEVDRLLKVHT